MTTKLISMVKTEIESFHEFLQGWFTGILSEDSFDFGFLSRLDTDCSLIPPGGVFFTLDQFKEAVRQDHGHNPDFRIAIRNVKLLRILDNHIVATYEEWQRNALNSTPPDNGRIATVFFKQENEKLKWLHVHETWLPEDVMKAGPYDF